MHEIDDILNCQMDSPSINLAYRFYARLIIYNEQNKLRLDSDLAYIKQYEMQQYLSKLQKGVVTDRINDLTNEILESTDDYLDCLGRTAYSLMMDKFYPSKRL